MKDTDMRLNSIRHEAILIILPLVIIPMLIVGFAGILYYREVIKTNIWDDNLAQAKALSAFTGLYLNNSASYLDSLAIRSVIINNLTYRNQTIPRDILEYAHTNSDFYALDILDMNGQTVGSYPDHGVHKSLDQPYVNVPLQAGTRYMNGPLLNDSGQPSIFISVPVKGQNGTTIGVLVGEMSTDVLYSSVQGTLVKNQQYVYLVNNTGRILVHSNRSYMQSLLDYSDVPAVSEVIKGREGIMEQYNPFEGDTRLASFSPVRGTGWGVVVALPVDVAYSPIVNSTWAFAVIITLFLIISAIMAVIISDNIVRPILGITEATRHMVNGGDYRQYLPLRRKDEIGELSRSFDEMSRRIMTDREKIIDQKNRAELYVDIMGHDINNLNQASMMNLELIQDDSNLNDEQRLSIKNALKTINSSAGIIENVRKIQLITDEKLNLEKVDVDGLIVDCVDHTPRPEGKKVIIRYTPRKGLMVMGTSLLKEVFCNLIGNSIKYSGDEVEIDIVVEEVNRYGKNFYDISVIDNGYGIPDEIKPKLFTRFQRGTTRAHGKGLGLFIARMLVERSGGTIEVRDRVKGDSAKGSQFIVSLPVCEVKSP